MTKQEVKSKPSIKATTIAHRRLSIATSHDIYDVTKRLMTYKKMVVVREPFRRLLSAFRNKFENNTRGDSWNKLAWKLHPKYSNMSSDHVNMTKPAPMTFEEFVKYLVDPTNRFNDRHWEFYSSLCSPCLLNYDFIIHMDTIDEDMEFVMSQMGIKGIEFPPSYISYTELEMTKRYFKKIGRKLMNELYKKYEKFRLRGLKITELDGDEILFHCPGLDCEYMCIVDKSADEYECPKCNHKCCPLCKEDSHKGRKGRARAQGVRRAALLVRPVADGDDGGGPAQPGAGG